MVVGLGKQDRPIENCRRVELLLRKISKIQAAEGKKTQGLLGKIAGGVTGMFGKMMAPVKGAGKGIMAMLKGTLVAGLLLAVLAFLGESVLDTNQRFYC